MLIEMRENSVWKLMWVIIVVSFLSLFFTACGSSNGTIDAIPTEDLTPKHNVRITVDFLPNLLFSKYGVDLSVDGDKVGSLPHGTDGEFNLELKEGNHHIRFE